MRIGEEVLTVRPRRRGGDTPNSEERGTDAGSCRWPNDVMGALAKGTVRVSGTVLVEMHNVDSGPEEQQKCDEGNEQNTGQGIRRPYSVAQSHS